MPQPRKPEYENVLGYPGCLMLCSWGLQCDRFNFTGNPGKHLKNSTAYYDAGSPWTLNATEYSLAAPSLPLCTEFPTSYRCAQSFFALLEEYLIDYHSIIQADRCEFFILLKAHLRRTYLCIPSDRASTGLLLRRYLNRLLRFQSECDWWRI